MSITHITPVPANNPSQATERPTERVVELSSVSSTVQQDRTSKLGNALTEIRTMEDEREKYRDLSRAQASTIRELNAHLDYLEERLVRVETDRDLYMRKAVGLAQQMRGIANLCEEGRELAQAADAEELPEE